MTTALRHVRLARGQSLRQLAAEVGISHEGLRRLEDGRTTNPNPSTRVALERTLGLPLEALLASTNENAAASNGDDGAKNVPTTARQQEVRS